MENVDISETKTSSIGSHSDDDEGQDDVKRRNDDRTVSPMPPMTKPPLTKRLGRSKSRLFQKPDSTFVGPRAISPRSEDYQRVHFRDYVSRDDTESSEASKKLLSMCDLRDKYVYKKPGVYWGSYDPVK